MAETLECAACRARVAAGQARCPRCGGRPLARLGLLDRWAARSWFAHGAFAVVVALVALIYLSWWGVYFITFPHRALEFFGINLRTLDSAAERQRLEERVREAGRSVPAYPGATRLSEQVGANPLGSAPTLRVCWAAPAAPDEVVAFYRRALPAAGWRLRRVSQDGELLAAQRHQIRLLVQGGAAGDPRATAPCPSETTYTLWFTAALSPGGT